MVEKIQCELCGAETRHPVAKTIEGRALNFCCTGCLQVYELQREEGRDQDEREARDQTEAVQRQSAGAPSRTITLPIAGMSCANCAAHVEGSLRSVPGVLKVSVNLAAERAAVEIISGAVTMADLKQAVEDVGYEVLDVGDLE